MARVRGGKATANRVVRLLGAVFSYAVKHKMHGDNPVRGVAQFEDGQKRRRLSSQEYRALGEAMTKSAKAAMWPPALAAAWFLALTGWRSGEALGLRWNEVDLERRTAFLADTKTGRSSRPLWYIHSADALLLAAADAVADRIADLMGDRRRQNAKIVPLRA